MSHLLGVIAVIYADCDNLCGYYWCQQPNFREFDRRRTSYGSQLVERAFKRSNCGVFQQAKSYGIIIAVACDFHLASFRRSLLMARRCRPGKLSDGTV